ncbi:hypothetical protein [Roseococcus sp. YIM B11640]|uniref:hypothetical protein n=1 Tax=Roseococcus sp. YIM B11640 TaxID=3133973 RepID=UPI003C7B1EB0
MTLARPLARPLALLLLATTSLSAAELPIRGVTLSSAGVAQIERAGPVPGTENGVAFDVPLDDVDDILRSLVVADPAGRLDSVTMAPQDYAAEAFRNLPVRPEDFASRAALLNALRGHGVVIDGVTGQIVQAAEVEGGLRVSLITDTGLRSLLLRDQEELRLLDPALRQRIATAARLLSVTRAQSTRQIIVVLRPGDPAPREVGATYVTGAPLWKPSWRLAVPEFGATGGQARLMGWAVVENRTGSDWLGIRLSLVSGEAAALRQALYTPVYLPRREVPVEGSGRVDALADTGARPAPPPPPLPAPAPMARMAAGAPAPVMAAEAAPAATEAVAAASLGRVAFTLAEPVSLGSGGTANLPFLDLRLPAERVWWVQGLGDRHPLQAVRLTNGTPHALPSGLATVFGSAGSEAGGFLGDAQILGMPRGETRLLAFARDRDVQYTTSQAGETQPLGVALRRATVVVNQRGIHTVSFAVDPRGTRGKFVADLPVRRGETPRFTPIAEGDFGLRVEAMLEGQPTRLDWRWEREFQQAIPLWDASIPEPLPPIWRDLNLERDIARLPGGNDRYEVLRNLLQRLPADAPGRADLDGLLQDMAETRRLMDIFRTAARNAAAAESALARARRAFEDRTGSEKEGARQALNAASLEASRTGAAADQAWTSWRNAAQKVVTRTSG